MKPSKQWLEAKLPLVREYVLGKSEKGQVVSPPVHEGYNVYVMNFERLPENLGCTNPKLMDLSTCKIGDTVEYVSITKDTYSRFGGRIVAIDHNFQVATVKLFVHEI